MSCLRKFCLAQKTDSSAFPTKTTTPTHQQVRTPNTSMKPATPTPHHPPPIVYTIAGSDSGGGAGIQADLHTIHALGCHGCSVTTCLTAQNSQGVTSVFAPPVDFLRKQWSTLVEDLRPRAIKIGMLSNKELVVEVASFLKGLNMDDGQEEGEGVFVVLDPVMVATSGARLIEDEAKEAIIEHLFPLVDIITPNKFEAEELLGRTLDTPRDVQQGARDIINMGVKAVIIKGGYTLRLDEDDQNKYNILSPFQNNNDVNKVIGHAQDYFLSKDDLSDAKECNAGDERMCDGSKGLWLRSNLYDSANTHGTGCTLSSAIASALAIGHWQRQIDSNTGGAAMAIGTVDACCIAKEYVTAGVARGMQLGSGPGPVVHTSFANSSRYFPSVPIDPSIPNVRVKPFLPLRRRKRGITFLKDDDTDGDDEVTTIGKIIPIVDNMQLVERLCQTSGVTDIQLRVKINDEEILPVIKLCQAICAVARVRLWINDYWKEAIQAGCFGVHLGQEDLARCILHPEDDSANTKVGGGLDAIRDAGLALGISTHSYAELSVALGLAPSYVSLGPIYPTSSKNVGFGPQGVETVETWRNLLGDGKDTGGGDGDDGIPLVVIGGIGDVEKAGEVWRAGADCVAVIGAITGADNLDGVVRDLTLAME